MNLASAADRIVPEAGTMTEPRKVLILTYHFPPSAASGSFRMLGFARHLPLFGWQPLVVAPPCMPYEPLDPDLGRQVPAETVVRRVPYPWIGRFGVTVRLAYNAVWLPKALAACVGAIRVYRPAALFTSSPPHCVHLLGLYLKRLFGLPWVVDFRDPWLTGDRDRESRTLRAWWTARWEAAVMQGGDAIVANAPRASERLCRAYPLYAPKVVTITNGFDPERFAPSAPPLSRDGTLTLFHAGELYEGRDPRPLLDALQGLLLDPGADGPRYRLRLLGRLNYREGGFDPREEVSRRGLEGVVEFAGQVAHREALHQLAQADVLLLLDSPGREVGVPAKLYEYLGAGRPILALAEPDGDVAWVLRRSGLPYRIAPPRDPGRIRQALVALTEELQSGSPSAAARQQTLEFSRQATAGLLAAVLDRCTGRAGRAPVGQPYETAGAVPPGASQEAR